MKTINHLFGFLFLFLIGIGNSYSAASTIIYPDYGFDRFMNRVTKPLQSVSTAFTESGELKVKVTPSGTNSFGTVPPSAIKSFSLKAAVNIPLLRTALVVAKATSPITIPFLALAGLEYLNGQWTNSDPSATLFYGPGYPSGVTCAQLGPMTWGLKSPYSKTPICHPTNYGVAMYSSSNPYCPAIPGNATYTYAPGNCAVWYGFSGTQGSVPITQQQAESIAQASPITPTAADVQALIDAGYYVPVQPKPDVVIDFPNLTSQDLQDLTDLGYFQPTPESIAVKSGSAFTDPVTGQKQQPMTQLDPAPNGGVRATPYTAPIDANGQPATDAQGNPLPLTQSQFDPCELNPDRAGCANLGTPEETEIEAEQRTVTGQFNEFNISGQCPADKSFTVAGMTHTIQMAPICGAAQDYIKPFLLLMASVTAYFIFVGGLRT